MYAIRSYYAPPSLFGEFKTPEKSRAASQQSRCLVDLLYDGFYMVFLLKNRKAPSDAEHFTTQIQKFLGDFERRAQRNNFV